MPARPLAFPPALALAVVALLNGCGAGDGGAPAPAASSGGTSSSASSGGTSLSGSSSGATSAVATCGFANFQADLLAAINAVRQQGGVCGSSAFPPAAAVAWNDELAVAATSHSADMASQKNLSHTGSDGSTLATRAAAAGYRYSALGENIAWNYGSVADVMSAWLQSPGHCENLLAATYRDVGGACVRASDSSTYWTLDLGAH